MGIGEIKVDSRLVKCLVIVLPFFMMMIAGIEGNAQDDRLNFFSLSRVDGLSDNNISSITKDHEGFIWFGTINGLSRYNGYDFTVFRFSEDDSTGLPGNHITSLQVDQNGVLWVGIFTHGIARYNAKSNTFTRYSLLTSYEDYSPNEIRHITIDKNNNLWVATPGGLFIYNRKNDEFEKIPLLKPHENILDGSIEVEFIATISEDIPAITADEKGGIWIVYPDLKISYIHLGSNTSKHYFNEIKDFSTIEPYVISTILYHNQHLYIATFNQGLIYLNLQSKSHGLLTNKDIISTASDLFVYENNLWVSTFNGLIKYNLNTDEYSQYFDNPNDPKTLKSVSINVIYIDDLGLLWIGAGNFGINYANLHLPFNQIYVDQLDPTKLSQPRVNTLMHDSKGKLWVGYQSGAIEFFSTDNNRIEVSVNPLREDAGVGAIFRFIEVSNGDIYMGSWMGGLQKYNKRQNRFESVSDNYNDLITNFHGVDVRDIEEDYEGNLWAIIHGKGLLKYDVETDKTRLFISNPANEKTLSNDYLLSMCFDDDFNLWATSAWGLNRFNINDTLVNRYFTSVDKSSISSNTKMVAYKDSEGRMWFGGNNGISLYNPEKDGFFNIKSYEYGLPQLVVKGIEEDRFGNLWITTTNGIIRIDVTYHTKYTPEVTNFFVYDVNHGVLSEDFFYNSSSQDILGNIYFGGISGIDYFNPEIIIQPTILAPTQIEEFRLFNTVVYPGTANGPEVNGEGKIVLAHDKNMLGFKFVALNYLDIQRNNYYYKLEPLDEDWHFAGNERNVTFANLVPGEYRFSVKTCINIADCDEAGTSISFIITPPFWQTNLFRILIIITFIAGLVAFQLLWTAGIRRKKEELERLVKIRTNELEQSNKNLIEQKDALDEANTRLEERQQQIEEQSEEIMSQSDAVSSVNKELKSINLMKDKLLSVIAHDLKNPFGTILGFSELIRENYDSYDDERRKQLLGYIYSSTQNTYMLLENLLQWSKAQTKRININGEKLDIHYVAQSVFGFLKGVFNNKQIQFKNNIDNNIYIFSDEELTSIILRNLLTNASKFTPKNGKVTLEAAVLENEKMVRIDVSDTGKGIPEDVRKSLFNSEGNISRKGTDGETGSGLGLTLCMEFVEKLGGKIWVGRSSEKGTTFSFTLPLAQ